MQVTTSHMWLFSTSNETRVNEDVNFKFYLIIRNFQRWLAIFFKSTDSDIALPAILELYC